MGKRKKSKNVGNSTNTYKLTKDDEEGPFVLDEYRNNETPCCIQVQEILFDVFPEMSKQSTEDDNTTPIASQSHVTDRKKSKKHGNKGDNEASTVQSSILCQIIRKHFVDMHRGNIGETEGQGNNMKTKRRKRKKKKSGIPSTESTTEPTDNNKNKVETKEKSRPSPLVENIVKTLSDNTKDNSQMPTIPPNRDLTSFLYYLECQLVDHDDKQHPPTSISSNTRNVGASGKSKSKHAINVPTRPHSYPAIYMQQLHRYAEMIKCGRCKSSVKQYLNNVNYNYRQATYVNNLGSSPLSNLSQSSYATNLVQINAASVMITPPTSISKSTNHSIPSKDRSSNVSNLSLPVTSEVAICSTTEETIQSSHGDQYKDSCIESAFDYVAMEEGCTSMTTPTIISNETKSSNQKASSKDDFCIYLSTFEDEHGTRLLQPIPPPHMLRDETKTNSCERKSSHTSYNPFTLSNVECLLEEIILPCASDVPPPSSLSSNSKLNIFTKSDEHRVQAHSKQLQDDILSSLKQFGKLMNDIQLTHDEVTGTSINTAASFSPKISTRMQEYNSKCDSFLESLQTFLLMLHQQTLAARSSLMDYSCDVEVSKSNNVNVEEQTKLKWLNGVIDRLWDDYDEAVSLLIEPTIQLRGNIIELANKETNLIPSLYTSEIRRYHFRNLLEEKFNIISQVHDKTSSIFLSSGSGNDEKDDAETIRIIASISSHYNVLHHKHAMPSTHSNDSDPLPLSYFLSKSRLDKYKELLDTRLTMISKTINENKASSILSIQSKRNKSAYTEAMSAMKEDISNDFLRIPPQIKAQWTANKILIEEKACQHDDNCDSGLRFLPDSIEEDSYIERDRRDVKYSHHFVTDVMKQLRLRDKIEASVVMQNEIRCHSQMNHSWSSFNSISENGSTETSTVESLTCDGRGGKRRVLCLISAHLYSWLRDQCMIWHADLTQKELIAAVEDEVNLFADGSKERKNKKKNKRATSSNANERRKDDNDPAIEKPLDEGKKYAPHEDVMKSESTQSECTHNQKLALPGNDNGFQNKTRAGESKNVDKGKIIIKSVVGAIVDYRNVIPAEDYLVNRFLDIIKMKTCKT